MLNNIIIEDVFGKAVEIAELQYDKGSKVLAYRYSPFDSYKFSKVLSKFSSLKEFKEFKKIN